MLDGTIQECLIHTPASHGDDLLGFELDLSHYLETSGLFQRVVVSQTGDPHCALVAYCTLTAPGCELDKAVTAISQTWVDSICYPFFHALEVHRATTDARIRFVTTSGRGIDDLCVTGEIRIAPL